MDEWGDIIIAAPDVDPNPDFPIEIDAWQYGANFGGTEVKQA